MNGKVRESDNLLEHVSLEIAQERRVPHSKIKNLPRTRGKPEGNIRSDFSIIGVQEEPGYLLSKRASFLQKQGIPACY